MILLKKYTGAHHEGAQKLHMRPYYIWKMIKISFVHQIFWDKMRMQLRAHFHSAHQSILRKHLEEIDGFFNSQG